ncbi:MAG: excisionase family DNA-binding protein [Acidobacteria bacterium]|nr:excisionase family DNA-binding protein [Acidobacteriota bacterium]
MSSNIRITRVCQHCHSDFTARTTVTKYCGENCAKRAYKVRLREGKISESIRETVMRQAEPITSRQAEVKSKDFLSITDASDLVGVSRWTLSRAIKNGRLNAVRFGKRVILKRDDIDRLFPSS